MRINKALQAVYKLTKWLLMLISITTLISLCFILSYALTAQQHTFNLVMRIDQYMQHNDKSYCSFAKQWETEIKPYFQQQHEANSKYYFLPKNIKEPANA